MDPRFKSFDESTSRFPQDHDSSIYNDSEPGTRISVALSDGGAVIGFSLLQNFAGGSDDSDDEDGDSVRRTLVELDGLRAARGGGCDGERGHRRRAQGVCAGAWTGRPRRVASNISFPCISSRSQRHKGCAPRSWRCLLVESARRVVETETINFVDAPGPASSVREHGNTPVEAVDTRLGLGGGPSELWVHSRRWRLFADGRERRAARSASAPRRLRTRLVIRWCIRLGSLWCVCLCLRPGLWDCQLQ